MVTLIEATQVQFEIDTHCVVVGAGACGLICALRLSEAGITPLVLERDAQATGSTSMSSGFIPAAGTRQQEKQGIVDSPQLFASDIQRKASNEAEVELVNALSEDTARALDWLEDTHGFSWQVLDDFLYPGHSAHRMHCVSGKTGIDLQHRLLNACTSAQVDVITNARVDALIVQRTVDKAKLCGVRIIRPDGSFETVRAKQIVLACNGYGANPTLMGQYIPEMRDAQYYGHAGNTGDAVQWALQLNLPLRHMSAYQGHGSLAVNHNILITWAIMMDGGVQLNQLGQRFSNEHAGYSEQAVIVLAQPKQAVWNIYDQRLHNLGMTFPDYQQAVGVNAVVKANSVDALAGITGISVSALKKTLEHVISLAEHNQIDEFGRQFKKETKLIAPFYAVKVAAAVFHTQGGLTINQKAQVLDAEGKIVPHLTAGGGAACGVSGSRVEGYLSGNGLLTAIGLGYIAANTVIKELEGSDL